MQSHGFTLSLNTANALLKPLSSLKKAQKAAKQQDINNNSDENGNSSLNGSADNMSQMTSLTVLLSEASVRNKNESPAERKQRKGKDDFWTDFRSVYIQA